MSVKSRIDSMMFSFKRFEGSGDDIHWLSKWLAFKMHPAIDNL